MFPIRKLGAINLNLWTGSRIQKPEVVSKVSDMARNVVKFTIIRKIREKIIVVKPEVDLQKRK